MKKALSLILVLMLCISLCACKPSKKEIENSLQGTWNYTWYASAAGFYCSVIYTFDDGNLTKTFIRNNDMTTSSGFYLIEDEVIEIYIDGDTDPTATLTYTYEDGELSLVDYGDGTVKNRYLKK